MLAAIQQEPQQQPPQQDRLTQLQAAIRQQQEKNNALLKAGKRLCENPKCRIVIPKDSYTGICRNCEVRKFWKKYRRKKQYWR